MISDDRGEAHVENYEVIKIQTIIPDIEYILPFVIDIELKSPDGEIGHLQATAPITLINFVDPLPLSVEECRQLYAKQGKSILDTSFSHDDVDLYLGIISII